MGLQSFWNRKKGGGKVKMTIPERILESLNAYAKEGRPTGGFLRAVLENNLSEAFGRADEENRKCLFEIVSYVYNELPIPCWGSPEKVKAWLSNEHK